MQARYARALVLLLWSFQSGADLCAARISELEKTERLKSIQSLFQSGHRVGLVNESKGSFVILTADQEQMTISFYTSGLFDLFPIKREGPVLFCDTGKGLEMIGIGRTVEIRIVGGKLVAEDGSPKRIFAPGEMPELLRKLHHLNERGIASEK